MHTTRTAPARESLEHADYAITAWLARHGLTAVRWSLGVVFVWFGALKPLGVSPALELVTRTVYWFDPGWFVPLLGWWEVAIGICLVVPRLVRLGILLLALQMPGTFLPLVILPDVCWSHAPWAPTLEGQYIIKNLVLIAAAMALGGAVRRDVPRLRTQAA
ncbi:MAG: hypothetical protein U0637_07570 [Phycisphaerales bacterium]